MNVFFSESTTYEIVLFALFSFFLANQLFYYLVIFIRLTIYRKKGFELTTEEYQPVSVVICARNEEDNLREFLPLVLEQKYPNYEVVVVNDCSEDDTEQVLKSLKERYGHLRTTTIKKDEKFTHGKKLALTIGIKSAKYEWLLLIDADCKPDSPNWITSMASNFHHPNEMVLGYGGYIREKGFLNSLICYDTFFIALQYLSFALFGKPYMGVGRNLAYRKELFFKNKGFASHSFLPSGDDDLFVQQVAKRRNTTVEFRRSAHTRSKAHTSFGAWIKQKRRHLTTGNYYKAGTMFLLAFEPFTRLLFWTLGIYLLSIYFYPIIVGAILAFRLLLNSIILKIAMNRLNERKIFLLSLLYDLFSPIFFSVLMVINSFSNNRNGWRR